MTFKIFNCYNGLVEIDIGQKEIDFIVVTVLQGDEIVRIYFKDGTSVKVDSCGAFNGLMRVRDFYDATYVVKPDRLKEWIDIANKYNNPECVRLVAFNHIENIDSLYDAVNGVKIAQLKRRNNNEADDIHFQFFDDIK